MLVISHCKAENCQLAQTYAKGCQITRMGKQKGLIPNRAQPVGTRRGSETFEERYSRLQLNECTNCDDSVSSCSYSVATGTFLSLTITGRACQAASNSQAGSYRCHRGRGQACWPWRYSELWFISMSPYRYTSISGNFSLMLISCVFFFY